MATTSRSLTLLLALALLLHSAAALASDSALSVLNSTDDIKIGGSVLAIAAIVVGVFMCITGYRLFRIAIFVCGFILGGIGVASLIEWAFKNESWLNTASWIGFFAGGLLVGMIAMSLYSLSIFVAGASGGVLLAFAIHTTVAYKISQSDPNVVLVILAVALGLICGVLAIKLEKPVLIIATSFVGAIAVAWGVGYFAGEFPNGADLKHYASNINGDTIISIPSAWWGYLAGILVLFVFGMYVQFHKTGRGQKYHQHKGIARSQQAVPPQYVEAQTPPGNVNGNPRYGNPISHV